MSDTADKLIAQARKHPSRLANALADALVREQETSRELRAERDDWRERQNRSGAAAKDNHDAVLIERQYTDVQRKRAERAEADARRYREALEAVLEVASVAYKGDPWYFIKEGFGTDRAFVLARDALAAGDDG